MKETDVYKAISDVKLNDVVVSNHFRYFKVISENEGHYTLNHLHQFQNKSEPISVRLKTLQEDFKKVNWDQVGVYIINREDLGEGFFTKMEIAPSDEDEGFYDLLEMSNGEPYYEAHEKEEIHQNIQSDLLSNGDRFESDLECRQYELSNRLTFEGIVKQTIVDHSKGVLALSDLSILSIRESVMNKLYDQTFGFRAGLRTDSMIDRLVQSELKQFVIEKLA